MKSVIIFFVSLISISASAKYRAAVGDQAIYGVFTGSTTTPETTITMELISYDHIKLKWAYRWILGSGPKATTIDSYVSIDRLTSDQVFMCSSWDMGKFGNVSVPAGTFYSCTNDLGLSVSESVPVFGYVQMPCSPSLSKDIPATCKLLSYKITHP